MRNPTEVSQQLSTPSLCDYTQPAANKQTWEELAYALAVLPDGRLVSGGMGWAGIKIWEINAARCIQTLLGHNKNNMIGSIVVHPNGQLVSASSDKTIKLWDLNTAQCVRTMTHGEEIDSLALLSNGRLASSSSAKNMIKLWDLSTGQCERTMQENPRFNYPEYPIVALPNGQLASGSNDYTGRSSSLSIKVWDLGKGRCVQTFVGHSNTIFCLTTLPNGQLASGDAEGIIKVWDLSNGRCVQTLKHQWIRAFAVIPSGQLVSGAWEGTIKLWDLNTGQCIQTLVGHSDTLHDITVLPNGQLVSCAQDEKIKFWYFSDKHFKKYFDKAQRKFKRGNYQKAIINFNKALETDPECAEAFYQRAQVKTKLEDYEGAVKDYESAIKHKSNKYPEASAELKVLKEKLKENEAKQRILDAQRREGEEKERKKQQEEEKQQEFIRHLEQLKATMKDLTSVNMQALHKNFQALETEAIWLKSVEYYIVRAQFYEKAAEQEKNSLRQDTFYNHAIQDYRKAMSYDPFVEGAPERIEDIEKQLKKKRMESVGFFASEKVPTQQESSSPVHLATRKGLNLAQIEELEQIKARLRQAKK